MPNEFDQLTCPDALRKECENLLAQVRFHQRQEQELRKQLSKAKLESLTQAYDDLFFYIDPTSGSRKVMPVTLSYEDFYDYIQRVNVEG